MAKSISLSEGEVIEELGELGELKLWSVDSSSEDKVNLSGSGSRSSASVKCIEFMNVMKKTSTNQRMAALWPCRTNFFVVVLLSVSMDDAHI